MMHIISPDPGIGKRWKFDKNIPDNSIWPQCTFCGSFLKLVPDRFINRNLFSTESPEKLVSVRICPKCHSPNYRKYYKEDEGM